MHMSHALLCFVLVATDQFHMLQGYLRGTGVTGIILSMCPANESSLIGWAHIQNDLWGNHATAPESVKQLYGLNMNNPHGFSINCILWPKQCTTKTWSIFHVQHSKSWDILSLHWKPRVVMVPTLSSLMSQEVVMRTTSAINDENVGMIKTRTLQESSWCQLCHHSGVYHNNNQQCCQWQQSWHHDNAHFQYKIQLLQPISSLAIPFLGGTLVMMAVW